MLKDSTQKGNTFSLSTSDRAVNKEIKGEGFNYIQNGWEPQTGSFQRLAQWIKRGFAWSPGVYISESQISIDSCSIADKAYQRCRVGKNNKGKSIDWEKKSLNQRNKAHAIHAQLVALDIDQDFSLQDALANEFVQQHCGLIYTSASHQIAKTDKKAGKSQPACDRFRLIFKLETPISNTALYEEVVKQLMLIFPQADKSAKDISRIFYGNDKAEIPLLDESKLLPESIIADARKALEERLTKAKTKAVKQERSSLHKKVSLDSVTNREVIDALGFIPPRRPNTGTYGESFAVVGAICSHFLLDAEAVVESWSPSMDDWNVSALCSYFDIQNDYTIASLFYYAKQNGYENSRLPSKDYSLILEGIGHKPHDLSFRFDRNTDCTNLSYDASYRYDANYIQPNIIAHKVKDPNTLISGEPGSGKSYSLPDYDREKLGVKAIWYLCNKSRNVTVPRIANAFPAMPVRANAFVYNKTTEDTTVLGNRPVDNLKPDEELQLGNCHRSTEFAELRSKGYPTEQLCNTCHLLAECKKGVDEKEGKSGYLFLKQKARHRVGLALHPLSISPDDDLSEKAIIADEACSLIKPIKLRTAPMEDISLILDACQMLDNKSAKETANSLRPLEHWLLDAVGKHKNAKFSEPLDLNTMPPLPDDLENELDAIDFLETAMGHLEKPWLEESLSSNTHRPENIWRELICIWVNLSIGEIGTRQGKVDVWFPNPMLGKLRQAKVKTLLDATPDQLQILATLGDNYLEFWSDQKRMDNLNIVSVRSPGFTSNSLSDNAKKLSDAVYDQFATAYPNAPRIGFKVDGHEFYWFLHSRGSNRFVGEEALFVEGQANPNWGAIKTEHRLMLKMIPPNAPLPEAYRSLEAYYEFVKYKELYQLIGRLRSNRDENRGKQFTIWIVNTDLPLELLAHQLGANYREVPAWQIAPKEASLLSLGQHSHTKLPRSSASSRYQLLQAIALLNQFKIRITQDNLALVLGCSQPLIIKELDLHSKTKGSFNDNFAYYLYTKAKLSWKAEFQNAWKAAQDFSSAIAGEKGVALQRRSLIALASASSCQFDVKMLAETFKVSERTVKRKLSVIGGIDKLKNALETITNCELPDINVEALDADTLAWLGFSQPEAVIPVHLLEQAPKLYTELSKEQLELEALSIEEENDEAAWAALSANNYEQRRQSPFVKELTNLCWKAYWHNERQDWSDYPHLSKILSEAEVWNRLPKTELDQINDEYDSLLAEVSDNALYLFQTSLIGIKIDHEELAGMRQTVALLKEAIEASSDPDLALKIASHVILREAKKLNSTQARNLKRLMNASFPMKPSRESFEKSLTLIEHAKSEDIMQYLVKFAHEETGEIYERLVMDLPLIQGQMSIKPYWDEHRYIFDYEYHVFACKVKFWLTNAVDWDTYASWRCALRDEANERFGSASHVHWIETNLFSALDREYIKTLQNQQTANVEPDDWQPF